MVPSCSFYGFSRFQIGFSLFKVGFYGFRSGFHHSRWIIIIINGAWGLVQDMERRGEMISLAIESWVNPRNFQVSMRQNLCQTSLDVRKKLKYLVLQELIGCSHQLFVSINALMRRIFLKLLILILSKCSRSILIHHHSLWASIWCEILFWNC